MLLPLLPGTLPPSACYDSEQARLNAFMAVSNAVLAAGQSFYNFGSTTPSVANQGYPWFRTTDGRWYFFSGVWKSPVNYSTFERRLFVGDLTDLQTYDGGDTGTPSPTSGPMWIEDTAFQGRSPMAPGTIPTSNPSKTLSVEENYGEGAHTQTIAEMASHNHTPDSSLADSFLGHAVIPGTFNVTAGGDTIKLGATANTGGGEAMPVIHPVRGCYVIKWSGRQFYVA